MATGAQLDEYDRLEKKHKARVAEAKQRLSRALPRATAQLAVALAGEDSDGVLPDDISQREGFDADSPSDSLSEGERLHLPSAALVIDALRDYLDLTIRLKNQRGPQVGGRGVSPGRL